MGDALVSVSGSGVSSAGSQGSGKSVIAETLPIEGCRCTGHQKIDAVAGRVAKYGVVVLMVGSF